MPKLFDRVKVNIATTGTGTVTFGPASSPAFLTPSEAGAVDGNTVRYAIVDGTDFEEGVGTILASVAQMARTTVTRSKIGGVIDAVKINLSGTAVLVFTAGAADILNPANNLSDLASAATARSSLGLGSAAVRSDTFFLGAASNLSDLANVATARINLGLGSSALLASSAVALITNNLSDIANKATARTNLGAIGAFKVTNFTASGTFTTDSKTIFAWGRLVGGGGGGGSCVGHASYLLSGGGGGGGGYADRFLVRAVLGVSQSVAIGAGGAAGAAGGNGSQGGTTAFGTIFSASGGFGGTATGSGGGYHGGSGGVGTNGDTNLTGESGAKGWYSTGGLTGWLNVGGAGGNSLMGVGGAPTAAGANDSRAGIAGISYGGGGSGGAVGLLAVNVNGAVGYTGFCTIVEFLSE